MAKDKRFVPIEQRPPSQEDDHFEMEEWDEEEIPQRPYIAG